MTSRALGACWLRGEPDALSILPRAYERAEDRKRHVEVARTKKVGPEVLRALRSNTSPERTKAQEAIDRLAAGPATVVVTGQQAGLLLGPRYTFHKALSAIAIASALEAETGTPCVPVFWVQDEDHDFLEAAECAWLSRDGELERKALGDDAPRVPVGDRSVPSSVLNVLDAFEAQLSDEPFVGEARSMIAPWRTSASWSEAFCQTLGYVFRDEPLVILRGRGQEMARATQSYHQMALTELSIIEEKLRCRSESLKAAGFKLQVPVLARRSLSFFQEGIGTPRYRFECQKDDRLRADGYSYHLKDILMRLEAKPECFSTSALLRPIVQDGLLPVAAQVVGPGEASYLAQITELRAHFNQAAPMIIPRGRALWIEPPARRRLEHLGVDVAQALGDEGVFWASRTQRKALQPARLRAALLESFEQQLMGLEGLDISIHQARERTLRSVRRNIDRFVGKVSRSLAYEDRTLARRWGELQTWLRPAGLPQERLLGITDLVARFGLERLKMSFLDAYVPHHADVLELYL